MKAPLILVVFPFLFLVTLGSALPHISPRPLVIWHGLGSYNLNSGTSPAGMLQFATLIKDVHPGIFIHSVFIEQDLDKDRQAGFYGNVNDQIELVAAQLADIPELEGGFDAIGFSQGGQFLRAYIERYNLPPVNNLITFGSQHMGISDIPVCSRYDLLCQIARRTARQAVYGDWVQENLVQAQYFRDPWNLERYLTANHFLASINNEVAAYRNATYARNLTTLKNLVLVLFTEDKTVVPKESSWFGAEVAEEERTRPQQAPFASSQDAVFDHAIIPMRRQPIYLEDWIGLRELDERDAIVFETCKGEHMQLSGCWKNLVIKYAGGRD